MLYSAHQGRCYFISCCANVRTKVSRENTLLLVKIPLSSKLNMSEH